MYEAKVRLHSINEVGDELVTWEVEYPYFVHQDALTHRMLSRNASSSRAIPIRKVLDQVATHPAMPMFWGRNQAGMQAHSELNLENLLESELIWLRARDSALRAAEELVRIGLHKQLVNRILMPWIWIRVLYSATDFENFFHLRQSDRTADVIPERIPEPLYPNDYRYLQSLIDPTFGAQPEVQCFVRMMKLSYLNSTPRLKKTGEWHLPFLEEREGEKERLISEGYEAEDFPAISSGRCARISYLTHDGKHDVGEDIRLAGDLVDDDGWSPMEHPAKATPYLRAGNFTGWVQQRKRFSKEAHQAARPWYGDHYELLTILP